MKKITAKELEQKIEAGEKVNLIDVREDEEVKAGMIPGAKHIPLGDIPDRLTEVAQDEHYYIVCRSGGRSGKACTFLEENGYDATNVTGGMLDWEGEVEA